MTFDTEGEMIAYRRICDQLAKHPELIEKLIADAVKISSGRGGYAQRKLFAAHAAQLARKIREIVRNDILYWSMGEYNG